MTRMGNSEALEVVKEMYIEAYTQTDDKRKRERYLQAVTQVARMVVKLGGNGEMDA